MKRFLFLLIVALITITVLLFFFNPEILEKVWLWIVGLIGPIVALIKKGAEGVSQLINPPEEKKKEPVTGTSAKTVADETLTPSTTRDDEWKKEKTLLLNRIKDLESQLQLGSAEDLFVGTTLTLLRYVDDGVTTLGLLFYNEKFFCYTLEDTFREEKIPENTRIPAGTYRVDFNRAETGLTKKYRSKYSWFQYHIHLKEVPGYSGVYIHIGNNHSNTEGCILIADGIGAGSDELMITHSRLAYERFYLQLKKVLDMEGKVRIKIKDESWFTEKNLNKALII